MDARERLTRAQPLTPRLAVCVHGGLYTEADSLLRVRIMAPCFPANGVHPLFIIWKSGVLETLRDIVAHHLERLPPAYSPNIHMIDSEDISTGRHGRPVRATHGHFDNDAELLTTTLQDMGSTPLTYPVEWLEY